MLTQNIIPPPVGLWDVVVATLVVAVVTEGVNIVIGLGNGRKVVGTSICGAIVVIGNNWDVVEVLGSWVVVEASDGSWDTVDVSTVIGVVVEVPFTMFEAKGKQAICLIWQFTVLLLLKFMFQIF